MQPSIATTATSPEVDIVRTIERLENALLESISELKRMKRSISEMSQHFAIGKQIRQQPNSANGSTATSVYDRAIVETLQEINHRVTFKPLVLALSERGRRPHPQTIKRYLKHLIALGIIDNRQDVEPRGYGLVQWNGSDTSSFATSH